MERKVRYCTAEDDFRIVYSVEGEGPPLVVRGAPMQTKRIFNGGPTMRSRGRLAGK